MKIELAPNSKILGTKRVSSNGQVSGFTEYAGRDVLVILPEEGETPIVRRDARDVLAEIESLVEQQMHLAFREYGNLRKKFKTPENAAERFIKAANPKTFAGLVEKADHWAKQQVGTVEKNVQRRIKAVRERRTGRSKSS